MEGTDFSAQWRYTGLQGARPGKHNDLSDVPGITVGQTQLTGGTWLTGSTVVLAAEGAVAGVDVRGGGTASRELAALDPTGLIEEIHAVYLGGGSAFGLSAAAGVMEVLRAKGLGFPVGLTPDRVVPVVPAACIFDLERGGEFGHWPDAELAAAATLVAFENIETGGPVVQGNVGAGTGAVSGAFKGGVGSASIVLADGTVVAALVVLNSHGSAVNPSTGFPYAAYLEHQLADGSGEFSLPDTAPAPSSQQTERGAGEEAQGQAPLNTTLAVIATSASLSRAEVTRLAQVAQNGMGRAISPIHTLADGDIVFGLATGKEPLAAVERDPLKRFQRVDWLNQLFTAGADTLARAVVHALLHAETVETPGGVLTAYSSEPRL